MGAMPRHPRAEIDIDAPLDLVWAVMLDTAAYGEWNPFVVRADCPSPPSVGDPIRLHVEFANGRRAVSPERIRVVDAPHDVDGVRRATLAYVYEGLPARLGRLRRPHGTSGRIPHPTLRLEFDHLRRRHLLLHPPVQMCLI